MAYALDAAVKARLTPCDAFICMSGMYLDAARYAKRRYRSQVWIERGSRHILPQREILADLRARGPTDFIIRRELAGYELADRIVVPSRHVAESFLEKAPHLQGFPSRNGRRNAAAPRGASHLRCDSDHDVAAARAGRLVLASV
jgi:hypothetical protein